MELDILNFKPGIRCYFMDLGIVNFYMTQVDLDEASINGALNENYVYINLTKRLDFPQQIAFEILAFATYKNGKKGAGGRQGGLSPQSEGKHS